MTVELTRLDNGMIVATDRLDHVESVALGTWVDVGARNETPDINGISHMLEHMAFKGTRRRSALQISEEIEAVGGQMNAYTSRENTAYYCKVLHEDQELAIDVIADILQHSTLDAKELERERQVILQEIGQANDTPDKAAETAEDPLLTAVGHDPVRMDTLIARTGWRADEVSSRLLILELEGRIKALPGGLYVRSG